ncbi:MAG TPA: hypothetical protein VF148_04990 [Acidimicrobiia bacterium]
MAGRNKAVTKQGVGHSRPDDERRGLGMLALIAILTVLGIAIWLIVNSDD